MARPWIQWLKGKVLLIGAVVGVVGCRQAGAPVPLMPAHHQANPAADHGALSDRENGGGEAQHKPVVDESPPVAIHANRGDSNAKKPDEGCVDCIRAHGKTPFG